MNKDFAEKGMKMGLGTGNRTSAKTPGTASNSPSMPMKTANWPGTPGKSQPSGRNNSTPETGKLGPFQVKKVGV